MTRGSGIVYVTWMGVFLAIIQTCYFFGLGIWLTAAYPGYLTLLLGWFAGTVAGLYVGNKTGAGSLRRDWFWVLASLTAFYLSHILLKTFPYETPALLAHGLLITVSGAQAGHFFASNRALFQTASRLFFLENNGFVVGWVLGFLGFVWQGSYFIFFAPALAALILLGARLWSHGGKLTKARAGSAGA